MADGRSSQTLRPERIISIQGVRTIRACCVGMHRIYRQITDSNWRERMRRVWVADGKGAPHLATSSAHLVLRPAEPSIAQTCQSHARPDQEPKLERSRFS